MKGAKMKRVFALVALCAIAACAPQAKKEETSNAPAAKVEAAGPPETLTALTEGDAEIAASVVQVIDLATEKTSAKIFTRAGGDPAINGLYTYLAIYRSPAEGWRVFFVGDFNSIALDSQTPEQVVLKVSQSRIDANKLDPVTEEKRVIIAIPGIDAETTTVTPAK
jgi:hypothetical protein